MKSVAVVYSALGERLRLSLSQADMAKLLGVSTLSVYNWEGGKATPRRERLATIVELRGIGKREAKARLDKSEKKSRSR